MIKFRREVSQKLRVLNIPRKLAMESRTAAWAPLSGDGEDEA